MLGGPPLSTVGACLFNIVAATLHFWSPSPPCAPRGQAIPLCLQSTYHEVTNLQLLQMYRISWLVVELKDSAVWSNLLVMNTSNGNRLLNSTVQKMLLYNVWNVFIIIWTMLSHKCFHYQLLRLQLTLYSPQLVAEHAVNWYINISYSALWHLIRTATLMKTQLRLLGCYSSSTGKRVNGMSEECTARFYSRNGRFSPVTGSIYFIIPIFKPLNSLISTQSQAPLNLMLAHMRSRHNNRVTHSINYLVLCYNHLLPTYH